ncbi:MAG: AmmeMemoRadiSam system radical SAM enzyme [Desulforhabdus sp.]|jgi:pyruvate formate lyase activating enzyme|nr:AmmeMemoRadiSam system radical SAM enzyme [Desulforhabdus sp.]
MHEAICYEKREEGKVHCFLCAQHCLIKADERGKCGVRENRGGTLWSLVYGKLIAQHIDPIEKKPLYHFYPGTRSYSIATAGCNFRCLFCQNADISQSPREYKTIQGHYVPAETVVEEARQSGCATIAYTYTEPTIFMEYAVDVAKLAHRAGIKNVFVSNGFMTEESLKIISPYLDAANVDLKAFNDSFYAEECGARLKPVLKTLERMKKAGIWLEVTTLLIPGLNDDTAELRQLTRFLVELGADIPWHVSRFHPTYKLTDRSPTPVSTLHKARQVGLEAGLRYVYTGNIPGDEGENTFCHECGSLLIRRMGFSMRKEGLERSSCRKCGALLAGAGL